MKQDRKLLSREDHEIAYVRKLARETLKQNKGVRFPKLFNYKVEIGVSQLRRLCKAVLKFTETHKSPQYSHKLKKQLMKNSVEV